MSKRAIVDFITYFRIVILPVVYVFLFLNKHVLAAVFLLLAGLSDVLDGFLARYFKIANSKGAKLDTLADFCYYASFGFWLWIFFPDTVFDNALIFGIAIFLFVLIYSIMFFKKSFVFSHLNSSRLAAVIFFIAMLGLFWGFKNSAIIQLAVLFWIFSLLHISVLFYTQRKLDKIISEVEK